LTYRLPAVYQDLDELASRDLIHSEPATLAEFGFRQSFAFEPAEFEDAWLEVGREALRGGEIEPEKVDWLLMYSGLPESADVDDDPLRLFRYRSSRLQHELGLRRSRTLALSQQGCSGLLSSIDLACRLVAAEPSGTALCLVGDMLPATSRREIMYSLMSDAVAAVVVQQGAGRNRVRKYSELTQPYYWDPSAHPDELLAAYFPLAQRAIRNCLASTTKTAEDIRWFVPHNVSVRSWEILARLIGIQAESVWAQNISRVGHTVTCDHIINLVDMEKAGALKPGDDLLLFTFGFGARWSCLLLER